MVVAGLLWDIAAPQRETRQQAFREAEADLLMTETEEDRLIRLLVSGKITEAQLGRQRGFITKRLRQR
jgi:hypothetical protein